MRGSSQHKIFFHSRRGRPGFTLLESVVVLGVFVIIIVTVVNMYLAFSQTQRQSSQRQKIVSEANLLLDQISREIRVNEIAYTGTFKYALGIDQTLYRVDVDAAEAGNPNPNSDIYQDEHELVFFHDDTNDDLDTVTAYVFNKRNDGTTFWPSNFCTGSLIPANTVGLYRFIKQDGAIPECQKMFNLPGLELTDAKFYFSTSTNPYPDAQDALTDVSAARDTDCGPAASTSKFNGSYCTCTQNSDCYYNKCLVGTGRCATPRIQPAVTFSFTVRDANNPSTELEFQTTAVQRLYKR